MDLRLPGARALAAVAVAVAGGGVLVAQAGSDCTSAGCHDMTFGARVLHPAVEDCETCHVEIARPHPKRGEREFALVDEPPALCDQCHDVVSGSGEAHEPAAEGMCTTCHDPHVSDNRGLLKQSQPALCLDCHEDPTSWTHVHGPAAAGDCTACHAPHESSHRPLLVRSAETLCFDCHGDVQADLKSSSTVHPAIDDGCTACHGPHGSNHAKLLVDEGRELCFQCHGDVQETVEGAAVAHAVLDDPEACTTCHAPHAANQRALLREAEAATCERCHDDVVTPAMSHLHAPVADGDCTACHSPHGSAADNLLVAGFPASNYVSYDESSYPLCFECHDRDLVSFPDTEFTTGFRDGRRNLHFLHVNDPRKGRSCKLCHEIHGSPNPALIADHVPFGGWELPLGFERTATGGSCAPGCHQPESYDRESPVRAAPAGAR